jgi:ABC-2 type transport system permease protein
MVVHGDKLRWLAWLRVKMLLRGFMRRPSTLVFAIIGLLVLLFLGGELAFGLFFAFNVLSMQAATEVLYLLFSGMLLFWIVLPLLSYSTNEGLDVTKLQLFPLTRLEMMFSLLFSSLFDIWTVVLFILFGVTVVSWWLHSLALGLMTLLVVVVFYVVMVSVSQLILALLMRTLQSRRFRDLSIIILALFGSSCYFFSHFAFGANNILNFGAELNQGAFSPYLQWLPSGVAASSLRAAAQGNWATSFAMLGLLVIICALALYLWQLVLERSMSASESGASRRGKQRGQAAVAAPVLAYQAAMPAQASAAPATIVAARPAVERAGSEARAASPARVEADPLKANLFEQLQALVKKEVICFWRDPQLKIRIFQSLFYVVIFVVFPSFANSSGTASGNKFDVQYAPFVSAAVVFFFMLTLSLNTLGIERQSLTALFLFPINRRRLLWGKNLAVFLLGFVELVVLMGICVALGRAPQMVLPALVIGLAGMGIALACGNLVSIYFPRYQREIGRRGFAGSSSQAQQGGCLNQIMSLVALVATIVMLAPVALGIGIPFFLNMPWILLASIPLSLLYGLALYIVFTNLAARRMLATEPEILKATTRE